MVDAPGPVPKGSGPGRVPSPAEVGMSIETGEPDVAERAGAPCIARERIRARRGLVLEPGDALFLDFDGTLVDIAATPEAIRVPADLSGLLAQVQNALDGALCVLTGRPVADLDDHLAPFRATIAGVHGGEIRLLPSAVVYQTIDPIEPAVIARLERAVVDLAGVRIEPKGLSVAVHWREAPHALGVLEARLQALLARQAEQLMLLRGRRVFEILPRGVSKGGALADFAAHPPFVGRRPVMIGDDVSDESAFAAAERVGGGALRVAGEHFAPGLADFTGPDEVRAWLTDFLRRTRR